MNISNLLYCKHTNKKTKLHHIAKRVLIVAAITAAVTIPVTRMNHVEAEPAASSVLFSTRFESGWTNWSWGGAVDTVDQQLSFKPVSGWYGLYIHTDNPIQTGQFKSIQFRMSAPAGSDYRIYGFNQDWQTGQSLSVKDYAASNNTDGWQSFSIPLADLKLTNTGMNGLVIQDTTGKVLPATLFDDIQLQAEVAAPAASANDSGYDFTGTDIPAWAGQTFNDTDASDGNALLIWSNATATSRVTTPAVTELSIRAKADICNGPAAMTVSINGQVVLTTNVSSAAWRNYTAPVTLPAGVQTVTIAYTNDYRNSCDRNLRLDTLNFTAAATAADTKPADTPAKGSTSGGTTESAKTNTTETNGSGSTALTGDIGDLFVNPNSNAAKQAATWKTTRPDDAAAMSRLAAQPTATWFGNWSGDITTAIKTSLSAAGNKTPIFVAYNIPNRDCGNYSAGGAGSAAGYNQWISGFANGLAGHKAIVILEPDALALDGCLTDTDKQIRYQLLSDAISTLTAQGAQVYLDAGHSEWIGSSDMANRLKQAGVSKAAGFSLNVSYFGKTSDETAYGNKISAAVQKPFVIDTSRNGNGSAGVGIFCNPSGRAIGNLPSLSTGQKNVAAYLWIKVPGESDGSCNGGPAAGAWWPEYGLGLINNIR